MQLPHDGSLVGRLQYEIEVLESRIPHAVTIPAALQDILRAIAVMKDARNSIKRAAIDAALDDLQRQKDILCSEDEEAGAPFPKQQCIDPEIAAVLDQDLWPFYARAQS